LALMVLVFLPLRPIIQEMRAEMKPPVSEIVPAFNEEENLEPTVNTVLSALDRRFHGYELLITDDGSLHVSPRAV